MKKKIYILLLIDFALVVIYKIIQPLCEPCLTKVDCPPCISRDQIVVMIIGGMIAVYIFYLLLAPEKLSK